MNQRTAWFWRALLPVALLAGLAVRLPAVTAGYPYLAYVDEGHLLHPVEELLATGVWRPAENGYPELAVRAIAAAARLAAWFVPGATRERLRRELPAAPVREYAVIRPPELILVGHALSLLVSLGLIALAGLYARRLAGDVAGGIAALAAALLPALVLRGAMVIVDVYAAFFALAALALAGAVSRPRQWPLAAASGAACGLALVSKYPAGLVGLPVVLVLLSTPATWRERLRLVVLSAAAGAVAAVATMPSLLLAPLEVWQRIAWQGAWYRSPMGSYWDQALRFAEWDLPAHPPELGMIFMVMALAGIAVGLAELRWRREALSWVALVILLVGLHAGFAFQPFRNLLPLAALGCVTCGVLAGWAGERTRRPLAAGVVSAALLLALFGRTAVDQARARAALVDSRREAVDWLVANLPSQGAVLVIEEAAVAPRELARVRRPVEALAWERARAGVSSAQPRYLVIPELRGAVGVPLVPLAAGDLVLSRYQVRAVFGSEVGDLAAEFRGNRLRIYVLERRPGARRGNAATTSVTAANSSSGKLAGFSQNSPRPPAPHRS